MASGFESLGETIRNPLISAVPEITFLSIPAAGTFMPILHIDMDCFFAAVEEREHPEYKGKPVIVGASPGGRGVVSTCNYEARKFGLHSAMPISKAYGLCPNGIFVPPQFELYSKVSRNLKSILKNYSKTIASGGIDEAYLDISYVDYEKAKALAEALQHEIREKEHLSCSIGIGPNMLVAKVASDYKKPGGITIVRPDSVRAFLAPLPIRKLPGIGPRTEEKLHKLNIVTIGDIQKSDQHALYSLFGKHGSYLHTASHGIGSTIFYTNRDPKSIGCQRTFHEDTSDINKIHQVVCKLGAIIVDQLRESKLSFKTITVVVRYADFATFNRSTTLTIFSDSEQVLIAGAHRLIRPFFSDTRAIRLVGLRVTNLWKWKERQTELSSLLSL